MTELTPSTSRIAFASFIGTAIEFYDFYIYGLAVAMVNGLAPLPNSPVWRNNPALSSGEEGSALLWMFRMQEDSIYVREK